MSSESMPPGEKSATPSAQTLHGLDWLNFFLADVQTRVGPFLVIYLAGGGWNEQNVGIPPHGRRYRRNCGADSGGCAGRPVAVQTRFDCSRNCCLGVGRAVHSALAGHRVRGVRASSAGRRFEHFRPGRVRYFAGNCGP